MISIMKIRTIPLTSVALAFLLAPHCVPAQQVQPVEPAGSTADTGIYSPSLNHLSVPGFRGPAGSYGGAFGLPGEQKKAKSLNAAGMKSKIVTAMGLARSGWTAGAGSFSGQGVASWTAGSSAFGGGKSASWVAGANSFAISRQVGGIWRATSAFGVPSAASASAGKAGVEKAGSTLSASLPESVALPALSSSLHNRGSATASATQPLQSGIKFSLGPHGGFGAGKSSGISNPFGGLQGASGASGLSSSQIGGLSGRGTNAATGKGASLSQTPHSGSLTNPLSGGTLDSAGQLDDGLGRNPNAGVDSSSSGTQP